VVSPDRSLADSNSNNNHDDGNYSNMDLSPSTTATATTVRGHHPVVPATTRKSLLSPLHHGEWAVVPGKGDESFLSKGDDTISSSSKSHFQPQHHHPFADCVLNEEEEVSSSSLAPLNSRRKGDALAYHPELSTPSTIVAPERLIFVTPPATPNRFMAVSTADLRRQQTLQHTNNHNNNSPSSRIAKLSSRTLTQSERQAALTDVKVRLAQLRASRQPPSPNRSKNNSSNNNGSSSSTMVLI
jgi:hypothetical protein